MHQAGTTKFFPFAVDEKSSVRYNSFNLLSEVFFMANYKSLFMRYMDRNNIKYTDVKENVVKVVYSGDNLTSIPIYVFFDKDGDPLVNFKCWNIQNFKGDLMAGGMIACNDLNKVYRWVKFYLDDDCDVIAEIDAYVDEDTCGSECTSLVKRMVNIIDEGYPTLMHFRWNTSK